MQEQPADKDHGASNDHGRPAISQGDVGAADPFCSYAEDRDEKYGGNQGGKETIPKDDARFPATGGRDRFGLGNCHRLNLFDFRFAEQTLGQENEHHGQHRKGRNVFVFDGEIGRPEYLDEADHYAAQHRAGQRADAAEDGGGKRLHAGGEADIEVDHSIIEQVHEPGDGRERGADDEGQGNRTVDVDAQQACHLHILLAGALSTAERRLGNYVGEARHQAYGDDHDHDLDVGELNGKSSMLRQLVAAEHDRLQRLDARALGELDVVLQDDRHADCGNERRQAEGAAKRPIGNALDHPAIHAGNGHCYQKHDDERQHGQCQTGGAHDADGDYRDQRNEGSHHEHIAMGEVDHADDAIDHRVAYGDQAIDRPKRYSINEL